MSAQAAADKNREDIERQVLLLQEEYNRCGIAVELVFEISTPRLTLDKGMVNAHLRTTTGESLGDWYHRRTVDLWLAIYDMRQAVKVVADRLAPLTWAK